jgi:hypothetical protein
MARTVNRHDVRYSAAVGVKAASDETSQTDASDPKLDIYD